MRFVQPLIESEEVELRAIFHHDDSHRVRRRAHTILLSTEGFAIDEIARIYQTSRETVSSTFDRWEKAGVDGLHDSDRSGRPTKLTQEEAAEAVECLKKEPRSIKKALATTKKKRARRSVSGR